ncbi:MAG: arginase family protein [Microbacteriaceae bacterium]
MRFLVVPEWQGSRSARAMRLVDGAELLRGDLPSAATSTVEVPLEAGDERGSGVHRLGSVQIVRDRVVEALAAQPSPDAVLTVGGDCGVELGAVEHALLRHPDTAVVWFDAQPDLNTPASSPSGAFCGMVLRTLAGEGPASLVPRVPLAPGRIVLAGARELDPAEEQLRAGAGIALVPVEEPDFAGALVAAVRATGATSVYLHIDVDVLDPAELEGIDAPVPFGLGVAELLAAIRALRAELPLSGAGLCMFAPAEPDAAAGDLAVLLRLVGALAG